MTDQIVIIGGGLAAARFARSYRDTGGEAPIVMLSAELHLPYNRPPLSKAFLRGELEAEAASVEPAGAYEELDVEVRLATVVTAVDIAHGRVTVSDGSSLDYRQLVLASGALPRPLGLPGEDLSGVHAYRTLDDAQSVRDAAASATHALVVGAGFIGMETAASLRSRGLDVTLIEPGATLFAALRHPDASRSLERLYRERGIRVLLGDSIAEFHGRDGRLESATTRNGMSVEAQLAIVGVGVRPSTGYLDGAGITLDRGAVLVDENFETGAPGVFAIGDVASFYDPVVGRRRLVQHWTNANHHGERLGRSLAGEYAPYDQVAYFFTEVFGSRIGLLGDLDGGFDEIVTQGSIGEGLVAHYLDDGRLVAALISGQTPETQAQLVEALRARTRRDELSEVYDPAH